MRSLRVWIVGLCVVSAGCSRPVERLSFDADQAAREAMSAYDRNQDGVIDAKELELSPPLKSAAARFDRNGDGKLSADEIRERLADYSKGLQARMPMVVEVQREGEPVVGAKVTFTPEPFLGSAARQAVAVTEADGTATMQTEDGMPDVPLGLYRVAVSKADAAGKETLPAHYNTLTTQGQEIAPDLRDTMLTIRITAR